MTLIEDIEDILASEYQRTGKRSLQVKAVDRISARLDAARAEEQELAEEEIESNQWGVGYEYDDVIHVVPSEESGRRSIEAVPTMTLHKRRVGPWEQVE